MNNKKASRFVAFVGFAVGALMGGLAAIVLGFLLLQILFTLKPPTGDVTGMGGLILLLIPFGAIGGAVLGVKITNKLYAR